MYLFLNNYDNIKNLLIYLYNLKKKICHKFDDMWSSNIFYIISLLSYSLFVIKIFNFIFYIKYHKFFVFSTLRNVDTSILTSITIEYNLQLAFESLYVILCSVFSTNYLANVRCSDMNDPWHAAAHVLSITCVLGYIFRAFWHARPGGKRENK